LHAYSTFYTIANYHHIYCAIEHRKEQHFPITYIKMTADAATV